MINDLLSYSRLDSKERTHTKVNLDDILQMVVKNLRYSIKDSDVDISFENLPTLNANATQMLQLFQNLISNAIKFQSDKSPVIRVTAKRQHNKYLFCVSDNGIGLEPQYFERIFVLFQRLHANSKYTGTGIGLTLCKKIVELHGGKIWIESSLGKGSSFYLTLQNISLKES